MEIKSIFSSKTFWINLFLFVLSVTALVEPDLLTTLGIEGATEAKILKIAGVITAIVNLFLRYLTNSAVSIKSVNKDDILGGTK